MQLDEQIRDALASEARAIPADAIEYLRRIDYRPRRRAISPTLAAGLTGTAAAVAGTLVALGARHSGGVRGLERDAERPVRPPAERGRGDVRRAALGSVEERGERQHGTCARRHARAVHARPLPPRTVLFGPRLHLDHGPQSHRRRSISTAYREASPYTIVEGPAAPNASTVTLTLEDGSSVQATVANSSFAAWWPSTSRPTSVTITRPAGTQTEPLSFPPAPPTPAAKPASPRQSESRTRRADSSSERQATRSSSLASLG